MMKIAIKKYGLLAIIFSLIATISSCTKFTNPEPEFEEWATNPDTSVKRKVLVIGVDGLVGSQLKIYSPATISKLKEHAKYSYEAKADIKTSTAASWTTLLTGQLSSVHHVSSESFIAEPDEAHPHEEIGFNPSIIYRIEGANRRLKTASVVRNLNMSNILLSNADNSNVENSDVDVKSKTIDLITKNNPDFLIAQFSGLNDAGKNGGFVIDNPNYKSALDQIDTYIGEIVQKIESSSTYAKEKWLIVVTSPNGGTAQGTTGGLSDDEINTFCLYYNKQFAPLELKANSMSYFNANGYFVGTYQQYSSKAIRKIEEMGVRAQSPAGIPSNVFNASTLASKSISYDFKFRLRPEGFWNSGYSYTYNMMLGKDVDEGTGTKGWNLYSGGYGTDFMFNFSNGSKAESVGFSRGSDGDWHHYTLTYQEVTSSKTLVNVYVDGVLNASKTIDMGLTAFENSEPLTIGFTKITNTFSIPNYLIADLRVWKRSLTESEVGQIACLPVIESSSPLHNDVLASYRSFVGNNWVNTIEGSAAPNFTLSGEPIINFSKNFTVCEQPASAIYLQSIDLFPQVFYWLNLQVNEDWKIPGEGFLNNFLAEFYKD